MLRGPRLRGAAAAVMPGARGATYRLTTLGDDAALAAMAGTAAAAASSGSRADPVAAVARPIRNLVTRDMLILLGDSADAEWRAGWPAAATDTAAGQPTGSCLS